jgi:phosphatidylglycerol:prolipoprotein diacylglycerol transferase
VFPTLQLGPLAIQVPGLILLLGIWVGLTLSERYAPRRGIAVNTLYNLVFLGLAAGIIGARLSYIIRYPSIFLDNPASIISLNPGLLDLWGGSAMAFIAVMISGQKKNLAIWPTVDTLTPLLAVMAVALGLAHAASGSAFGSETNLPWAIELWGAQRHPTQIYETLVALIVLFIVWPKREIWFTFNPGIYFSFFIAISAAFRLFLEAFRADSVLILGGFRSAQFIAWIALALSLWAIARLQAREKPSSAASS